MKIGIDARFWSQTGVGRYIREIVKELALLDIEDEYVIYLMEEDSDKVNLPANFRKVKTKIRWHTFSEQLLLPIIYLKDDLDVLLVLNFNVPIFYPKTFVTTVHDLTLLRTRTGRSTRLPYFFYVFKYLVGCFVHYMAIKRSRKIFTVSEFVKNDIVNTFKIKPDKIVITPNAVDGCFYRRSDKEVEEVLKRFEIHKPYLFYVGNACVHKNLGKLVQAFDLLSDSMPNLILVLGGKRDLDYARLEKGFSNLKHPEKIKLIGYIPEADLPAFYSGAQLYVSTSLHEGFGIQILEAFACGCKVACSNRTSLPEVGGDLADYFDPLDEGNIVEVIKKALQKDSSDFADNALARVGRYSWKASALSILQTIRAL